MTPVPPIEYGTSTVSYAIPDHKLTPEELAERQRVRKIDWEQGIRSRFLDFVRDGVSLQPAAAAAGGSVRMIHNWLAEDILFRKAYHEARCESETAPLEPLRELAHSSVRAAIYLAERQRKLAERRPRRRRDNPPEETLARIETSLRTMFDGFSAAVRCIEDEELRQRLCGELETHVEPVATLFRELWQSFEISTT
jgi:hypothetical protein